MKILKMLAGFLFILGIGSTAIAQSDDKEEQPPLSSGTFEAFNLRGIGPAFMSGRIADSASGQDEPATGYGAGGAGGGGKKKKRSRTKKKKK